MRPLTKAERKAEQDSFLKQEAKRLKIANYDGALRTYAKSRNGCDLCETTESDLRLSDFGFLCRDCSRVEWSKIVGLSFLDQKNETIAFEKFFDTCESPAIYSCSKCGESRVGFEDEVTSWFRTNHRCSLARATVIRHEPVRLYECPDCHSILSKTSGKLCEECHTTARAREIFDSQLARELEKRRLEVEGYKKLDERARDIAWQHFGGLVADERDRMDEKREGLVECPKKCGRKFPPELTIVHEKNCNGVTQ